MVHQNLAQVRSTLKAHGIKFIDQQAQCEACIMGKMTRKTFPTTGTASTECGQIVHGDVCGPMHVNSLSGARYFLLLKDDFSHYRHIFFIKGKDEVPDKIENFLNRVTAQTPHTIRVIRTDNDTEYVNKRVCELLSARGIVHQTSVAYNPEQNGSAERNIRTVIEAARTMICNRELDQKLWAEAANTAVYVLNRTGTSTCLPSPRWSCGAESRRICWISTVSAARSTATYQVSLGTS